MAPESHDPLRIPAKGPFVRKPGRRLAMLAAQMAEPRYDRPRSLAAELETLYASVRGIFASHTPQLCPLCPKRCCLWVSRRGVMDECDLIFFAALGETSLPQAQPGSRGCPFISGRGCTLPWRTRPFACLHYVCPRLKQAVSTEDFSRLRQTFTRAAVLRTGLMRAYLKAKS